jgi:transcription termination factor Rho
VTETDLITAGGGENVELPNTVTSDISSPAEADASVATPTAETAPTADVASGDRSASLSSLVLPELRALAKQIGIEGASGMRKSELVAAIRERRGETNGRSRGDAVADASADAAQAADQQAPPRRERRGAARNAGAPSGAETQQNKQDTRDGAKPEAQTESDAGQVKTAEPEAKPDTKSDGEQQQGDQQAQQGRAEDDGEGRQGRRGRRFRDRRRRGERGGDSGGGETELREDDVVQPVAGILDVLDNYAFVRTSGYLAGPNDVYVSMNMVRKNGLRRGDAVTGAVRVPKEGEGGNQNPRQKFNPLVRLDSVNGGSVEDAKKRPEFGKLTPLYPNQRLRLETSSEKLTTRVIDLIMPIGKGQRALIVSPPKAGKTTILQDIANAITRNNPECHLMVVLVDERPEEVTDMQRSVKGEVISSTFDRPPSDHTQAAELAIERAKRLVEQGKDVVVLLDSITRLGRAYNNASPASGRILSGGVDSTALYPPKRFLGAARNIEEGGSLTIVATAMVETGSTGDTVIFEEFKGTGNAELKLDRKIAERRVFPAVDVNPSGTRKDELLLSPDEFAVVHKLRRVLSGLDSHQAIDLLMSQLRKTKTNYEFLVQVSKTAPGSMDAD